MFFVSTLISESNKNFITVISNKNVITLQRTPPANLILYEHTKHDIASVWSHLVIIDKICSAIITLLCVS